MRDNVLFVVTCVLVVGALFYMEQNLGQPSAGHGVETTKIAPAKSGIENAIWKI